MADDTDKTEPATPKKRQDARKKGQVAQSRDVGTVLLLLGATLGLVSPLGERLGASIVLQAQQLLGGETLRPSTLGDFHAVLLHHGAVTAQMLAPFALIFVVVAIVSNVAQIGIYFSAEAMAFRGDKLNPLKGLKRLVSVNRLYELAKSLFKLSIVGTVAWFVVRPSLDRIMSLIGSHPGETAAAAGELALDLVWILLAVLAIFAAIDFVWQRYQHEKQLRMSKSEVRDEVKQREGDPKVRARIKQMQRELSNTRMISSVAEADVVVTNPTHFAVALVYRPLLARSPKVVAKGRNLLALRIRREAEEHGIPLVENPPLAQLLYKTAPLDQEIPEALFEAVAEVLAYVYRLNPNRGQVWGATS